MENKKISKSIIDKFSKGYFTKFFGKRQRCNIFFFFPMRPARDLNFNSSHFVVFYSVPSSGVIFVNKVITFCKHIFCETCLDNWLKDNYTCPVCRRIIKYHNNHYYDSSNSSTYDITSNYDITSDYDY